MLLALELLSRSPEGCETHTPFSNAAAVRMAAVTAEEEMEPVRAAAVRTVEVRAAATAVATAEAMVVANVCSAQEQAVAADKANDIGRSTRIAAGLGLARALALRGRLRFL